MASKALHLLALFIAGCLAFESTAPFAVGFSAVPARSNERNIFTRCYAKKNAPPNLLFDLEAIEAFEEELEKAATLVIDMGDDGDDDMNDMNAQIGEVRTFTVPKELHNKRMDIVLSTLESKFSRSHCGSLVTNGQVCIIHDNVEQVMDRKSFKVQVGTVLRVNHLGEEKPTEIIAQDLPLNVLFEDEHMIVLNKAAGMVVHPAAGNWDGTVVNALAYYLANKSPHGSGDFIGVDSNNVKGSNEALDGSADMDGTDGEAVSFRPGIVHRLDKGTTGVLIVAKTKTALTALSESFASRTVKKTYLTVTVGNPGKQVKIDRPIGRHPVNRQKMRVVPDPHRKNSSGTAPKDRLKAVQSPSQAGRRALSFVDTLAFDGKLSVVQVRIETGRTHQIRVHLQDRHTPVYGDDVYGLGDWNKRLSKTHQIARPLLHAYKCEIDHPVTGERMAFHAPMADDMLRIVQTVWPQGEEEQPDMFSVSC